MKKELLYHEQLKQICTKMQESFAIKINEISNIKTKYYLKKLIKLNRKTNNEHIDEIIHAVGRTKLSYQKYCNDNNYIPAPNVKKKMKETYIELARKAMKIKTKRKNIKKSKLGMQIEYNSDRGSYKLMNLENGIVVNTKEYKIKDIKNLEAKRNFVLNNLKRANYGINIFEELEIDEKHFDRVNPDIIHILLSEGKVDYAKMYVKQVVSGETMNMPFKVKYVLNRNLKKGVFSPEENKSMKKMARKDRIANELVIFSDKKEKKLKNPKNLKSKPRFDIVDNIKRNVKIARIKEKIAIEKAENDERIRKIQAIKQKREEGFRSKIIMKKTGNNIIEETSAYGCKIYNIDRRNIKYNRYDNTKKAASYDER